MNVDLKKIDELLKLKKKDFKMLLISEKRKPLLLVSLVGPEFGPVSLQSACMRNLRLKPLCELGCELPDGSLLLTESSNSEMFLLLSDKSY
jgi:hypothetical protein